MIAHYLLHPELRHNMDFISEQYLEYHPIPIENLIGKKGKNQLTTRAVPIDKLSEYACEDADITWQLKGILEKELMENHLMGLFRDLEMPLSRVLMDMELTGFKLDITALADYAKVLQKELIEVEQNVLDKAGVQFNVSSPKQLGEVLFDKMKIDPKAKLTRTKQYSTSEETLLKLKNQHPIIQDILEYRSLRKLLSTYVEAMPKLINPKTGKVHTSFNQTVTATGRLSSTNPNLQNIPIREERGREIRKAFISSSPDNLLLAADYSQIELRLMAHMSQDTHMIEAFRNKEDIHTATAAKIHKVDIKDVGRAQRAQAKTANFGIIYGISAFGLSQRLDISRQEAKKLIDGYFESYPGVKKYMDDCIAKARDDGYVTTLMGRKRFLADINSKNTTVRGFAERNAINSPIQGTAADIIKKAMIAICREIRDRNLSSRMILQVHDELIFDVPGEEIEEMKTLVKQEMENACLLDVPIVVEMGTGNNWLEAHENFSCGRNKNLTRRPRRR